MAIKITSSEFEKKFGAIPKSEKPKSSGMFGDIKTAFKGGVDQFNQGVSQAKTATNPLQTLEAGLQEGAGVASAAFSPLAPATKYIGEGINKVADNVSNSPMVQDFAMSQAGQNTARGAQDVGNTADLLGILAGAKTPIAVRMPKGVGGGAVAATGRALKGAGEGAYGLTVTPEAATAKALLNYDAKQPTLAGRIKNFATGDSVGQKPVTEAQTAAKHGLVGTEYQIGVQAKKVQSKLWDKEIKPRLAAVKGTVKMSDFLGSVEKQIRRDGGDLTRRNDLLHALEKVKEDYKNVGSVNLSKLQDYKKGWAEFLPDSVYKGKPIASSLKEVRNMMADKARNLIHKNIGEEGSQAYIDYGNLHSIIKSAEKSIQGDPAAKSLGRDIWGFVMNKGITPVVTIGGKVLYKTGEGLELIGEPGAKTVGEAVGHSIPVPGSASIPQEQRGQEPQ